MTGDDPSPWTGAVLTTTTDAQKAMDHAGRLARRWPGSVAALQAVESASPLRPCIGTVDVTKDWTCSAAVDSALTRYDAPVFGLDLDRLASSLAPVAACLVEPGNLHKR